MIKITESKGVMIATLCGGPEEPFDVAYYYIEESDIGRDLFQFGGSAGKHKIVRNDLGRVLEVVSQTNSQYTHNRYYCRQFVTTLRYAMKQL